MEKNQRPLRGLWFFSSQIQTSFFHIFFKWVLFHIFCLFLRIFTSFFHPSSSVIIHFHILFFSLRCYVKQTFINVGRYLLSYFFQIWYSGSGCVIELLKKLGERKKLQMKLPWFSCRTLSVIDLFFSTLCTWKTFPQNEKYQVYTLCLQVNFNLRMC